MKKIKEKPTDAELEILRILWEVGPATVQEVNGLLNQKRESLAQKEVGLTTTLKMMQLMYQNRMLSRESAGRKHIYQAAVSQEATQKKLLNRLVDTAFGGSATKLVMQALGNKKTSKEDLAEIKKLIDEMEKGGQA